MRLHIYIYIYIMLFFFPFSSSFYLLLNLKLFRAKFTKTLLINCVYDCGFLLFFVCIFIWRMTGWVTACIFDQGLYSKLQSKYQQAAWHLLLVVRKAPQHIWSWIKIKCNPLPLLLSRERQHPAHFPFSHYPLYPVLFPWPMMITLS